MKVDDIINEKTSSLELSKTDKENEKRKPKYCERNRSFALVKIR